MNQDMLFALLRLTALALGALLFGATLAVIRLHVVAFHRAPSGSGIVPLHVILVSSGALSLTASGLAGVLASLGGYQVPLLVRYALYLYGVGAILVSLVVIGREQRRRVRRVDARIAITPIDADPLGAASTGHRRRRQHRVDTQPTPVAGDDR